MSEHPGVRATARLDKWLWAARFFKTRTLAADACSIGRVEVNGVRAKPSREVKPGDRLQITNHAATFTLELLQLSGVRGPAAVAQGMYLETDASRELRLKQAEERKQMHAMGALPEGRPSKRDRRAIQKWKGGIHRF